MWLDTAHICVVGLGYIGLPTAAMFASRKIRVTGVDVNPKVIEAINNGRVHIVEPDLDIVVQAAVTQGYLKASLKPEPASAFLIAVPTPFKGEDRQPDLAFVHSASLSIAPVLKQGDLVILESTSPVGSTEQMAQWLAAARPDLTFPQQAGEASDIRIAHCPERVLPGRVMIELISNDRIIGGMTRLCAQRAEELYKVFVQGECVVASNSRIAEMAKLTENSFRDVNIAFANELSLICDKLDMDVWELIRLANRHPRVNILQPGPGVGGHCIAVDPWFIVSSAPEQSKLIRTARNVNDFKPHWVLEKVKAAVGEHLSTHTDKTAKDVTIACYGLAFKPDIDDLRESPAVEIVRALATAHPGPLIVIEPYISELPGSFGHAQLMTARSAESADIHVLLVDHKPFKAMARPTGTVIDLRGIWGGKNPA